ncbi:MAG: phage tail tape measure protein, partial [Candidatus Bathyarchaeota archaeon]
MEDILLKIGVDTAQLRKISGIVQKELAIPISKAPLETQKRTESMVKSTENLTKTTKTLSTAQSEVAKSSIQAADALQKGGVTSKVSASQMAKYQETLSRVDREEKELGKTTLPMVTSRYRTLSAMKDKGITLTKKEEESLKQSTAQLSKVTKGINEVGKSHQKGFASLIKWGLGWSTVYGLIRLVKSAIFDVIKSYMQLDDTMARVSTVTRTTGIEHETIMNNMRRAVLMYTATSRAELTDVAKTMYYLGSAGLTVEQQMGGFKHIMDLTIGTVGKADEAAKLVAGAFNVFGRSIENVSTDAERFKKIADILAYTYRNQQVELSDVASAFTLVGSAAGLLDIDFSVLVGTIGFLNTGMLKGTRAGTCYDKETEVLTKDGFKNWKDVTMDDIFATLNPKTHQLEYQKPKRIIREHYEGKMYCAINKHLDLKVTPNHWIYSRPGDKWENTKYEMLQAKDMFSERGSYRGKRWKGKRRTYLRGAIWKGKE